MMNIFIDTEDMEERYGEELYKEYLEREKKKGNERLMKKSPYVFLYITNSHEYVIWPYPEAQEFIIYDIPKSDCIYLSDNEVKQIENLLHVLQKERK